MASRRGVDRGTVTDDTKHGVEKGCMTDGTVFEDYEAVASLHPYHFYVQSSAFDNPDC